MAESSLAAQRSKRKKIDKGGRLSALDALKKMKEQKSKNKYQIEPMENIYDEVDEDSYKKGVLDRQYDDWIVDDDGGSGYVEDGREIFDDDLDDESVRKAAKRQQMKGPRKRKHDDLLPNFKTNSLADLFSGKAYSKKVEKKIDDDYILGDLMSELRDDATSSKNNDKPRSNKFLTNKSTPVSDDDKLLDNLIKSQTEKPKTVLDDIEVEVLYSKPSKTTSTSTVVKKETENIKINYQKPSPKEKLRPTAEVQISKNIKELDFELHDDFTADNFTNDTSKNNISLVKSKSVNPEISRKIIASDYNSRDDLTANNFSTLTSKNDTTFTDSGTSSRTSEKKTPSNDDLNQYIGDISDIDFDSIEIDTSIKSTCLDKSQMWKEKDADLMNDDVFAKVWEKDFSTSKPATHVQSKDAKVKMLPLPTTTNSNGENMLRFFWWDAYEDPYKQPGVVYLFGKVFIKSHNEHVSCCVSVKNIPRRIFLLPREDVRNDVENENQMLSVYREFNEYTRKLGIKQFRSQEVRKKYAFERKGVPVESDYLEIQYPATDPPIDPNFSTPLIEAVFGTSVNSLELFLIERNIKGPCWLDIKEPIAVENAFSWCKVQAICTSMGNISVTTDHSNTNIPPMIVATFNIQVSTNTVQQKNEIVNIGVLLHHKYHINKAPPKPAFDTHYCFVTHPRSTGWPMKAKDRLEKITQTKVIRCETELDLLEKFIELMQNSDPDIILGYDCGFQFDVLVSKILNLKVKNWSCLGKLKKIGPPYIKGKIHLGTTFCGRPICDITSSAKELNLKVRTYDLPSLCVAVLKKKEYECKVIKPEDCPKYYGSMDQLEKLIQATMVDASYILGIVVELNILPLALQITTIAGNTLSRTLSAGRAERNEFLLMHAFHSKGFITPDKRTVNKRAEELTTQGKKKKPAYTGGLVLDPKKGFYDKLILLMDFNSLYPSIIQEFNLCFTTVPGAAYEDVENLEPPVFDEPGIIPTEIRKLVESRIAVKKLMNSANSAELKSQYNIRQLALKLTANSMYGCLGATHCRFYAKGLAALVTMKGREILEDTKALVEKLNYDVIYGDTDSLMINTNIVEYDQVFSIGRNIKKEVNKFYKKVELDIDGVFKYLLLLQKKKYAAVSIAKAPNGQLQYTKEIKGLDIVRRDWCGVACDIGNKILDQLLSDQTSEDRVTKIFEILQSVAKNLHEGNLPLSSLVITKQLSKNPDDYPKDKKMSHVMVALRLNQSGGRKWKVGDIVPYIICVDGTDSTPHERAYHIEEFKKSEKLKIDVNYYLLNQIHPVILRICEPIQGIDDVLLAQHLGVEKLYKPKRTYSKLDEGEVPICVRDNRFDNCLSFKFVCRNPTCKAENEITAAINEIDEVSRLSLASCANSECNLPPWKYVYALQNQIQLDLRQFISKFYYGELECHNEFCGNVYRRIYMSPNEEFLKCTSCASDKVERIYKASDLFNQISFYLKMFTLNQIDLKNIKPTPSSDLLAAYDTLKEFVEKYIQSNAYAVVDLTRLFWPNEKITRNNYEDDQDIQIIQTDSKEKLYLRKENFRRELNKMWIIQDDMDAHDDEIMVIRPDVSSNTEND